MNKIKNIVIINDFDFNQGGASKIAIDTANLLARGNRYCVFFFSGHSIGTNELDESIIRVCTNTGELLKSKNLLISLSRGIYNFKAKRKLKKLLKTLSREETVVHIHSWTKCLSSSVFDIAFKMKFKVILTLHDYFIACPNGGFYNYPKSKACKLKGGGYRCVCTNCDSRNYLFKIYRNLRFFVQNNIVKLNKKIKNVIYVSNFSRKILEDNFKNDINARVIYNPISFNEDKIIESNARKNYFLFVGRISKEKGCDIFCEAVTRANTDGIVVGDGNQINLLKRKYPNINFVGWKDTDEVKKYMLNAKALIFPSKCYETMGLTVLEAYFTHTPAIVYKNCAACEFIEDKKYLFENIDELVSILKGEIKFSENSNIDLATFSNENYIDSIIRMYNEAL